MAKITKKIMDLMAKLSPLNTPTPKQVIWFTANQLADDIQDYSTKEMAQEIQSGNLVMKTEEDVEDYWRDFIEENDDYKELLTNLLIPFGYTSDYDSSKL